MEKKEKYKYVFKNFSTGIEGYVYMTNLSTNISVKEEEIDIYINRGYILGYCKPYINMDARNE